MFNGWIPLMFYLIVSYDHLEKSLLEDMLNIVIMKTLSGAEVIENHLCQRCLWPSDVFLLVIPHPSTEEF